MEGGKRAQARYVFLPVFLSGRVAWRMRKAIQAHVTQVATVSKLSRAALFACEDTF